MDRHDLIKILLKELPWNIYWKTREGIYEGCNDRVAKILGLANAREIEGKNDVDLLGEELASLARANDKQVFETGVEQSFEEFGFDEHGEPCYYLTHKKPLFDVNGTVIGLVGISIDISDKKEIESLKVEKEVIQQKVQTLKVAAGSIAHELRTPLASIRFAIAGLKRYFPKLLSGYKKAVEAELIQSELIRKEHLASLETVVPRVEREIKYANEFINLMLANIRFENLTRDNYNTVELGSLLLEVLEDYPFNDGEIGVVNLAHEPSFRFWGHRSHMKNVLFNLLKNALFFIKRCDKGQIQIWCEPGEKVNKLYFKDTSQGMEEETISKIFEEFYSKRSEGTGLGLTFCQKVIESFNGTISVESVLGEYTCFCITLPVVTEPH